MTTKVCSYCGIEKNTRGFWVHEKACREKANPREFVPDASVEPVPALETNPLRVRYAHQIANMTPEQAEKFLRKASGIS